MADEQYIPLSVLREYMPKLKDEDLKELGPVEYDQSKVPEVSKKHAENVRRKAYLPDMTESFARGVEYAGLMSSEASNVARTADLLSKDTQNRFKDQIEGTTNSDEVIDARRPFGGVAFDTLNDRLAASIPYVTYDLFGANKDTKYFNKADGKYYLDENYTHEYTHDDGIEIKLAHEFANANNLEVINLSGDYLLLNPIDIPIKTNVNWGESIFHIDESNYSRQGDHNYFVVPNDGFTSLSSESFFELKNILNGGGRVSTLLNQHPNTFLVVEDTTNLVAKRSGGNQNSGMPNKDFYYIAKNGRLVGDKSTDFKNITSVRMYKVPKDYLTMQNGTFKFNGLKPAVTGYVQSHIAVYRSKFKSKFTTTEMEEGVKDTYQGYEYSGFFTFSNVYDIEFESPNLMPKIGLTSGTYGIGGSVIQKLTLKNVMAESDDSDWGIVGLNYLKDVYVEKSNLNRFDTHYRVWNLHIVDTVLGNGGLQITGGGLLKLENVTNQSGWSYVNFRSDYGSIWKGNIEIYGGKSIIGPDVTTARLLDYRPATNHEYGENLSIGDDIIVENFEFIYQAPNDYQLFLMTIPSSGDVTAYPDGRIKFPDYVRFKNIKVKGRERGAWILASSSQNIYKVNETGKASENNIETNCLFEIDNVDTDYYTEHTTSASVLRLAGSDSNIDTYAPIPKFIFKNIKHLSLSIAKWYTNIEIDNSKIHFIYAYESRNGENNIYNPIKIEDSKLQIATAAGYSLTSAFNAPEALFINTTILPPIVSGSILNGDSGLARYLSLFSKTTDGKLQNINHAHLMTKLNKDFFASTTLQASEKYVLLNNLR